MTGKRGRPPMGVVPIHVRIPPEDLATIDAIAAADGITRAEAIRRILHSWLIDNGET